MPTFFDTFWEQSVRKFGGFSSLNLKDEASLKAIIHSLITANTQTQAVQNEPIDYERMGLVMYCAVKAALEESLPGKLQTYAVPEVIRSSFEGMPSLRDTSNKVENLPSAFFTGAGNSNFDSISADTSESAGISDKISALKQMQGDQ